MTRCDTDSLVFKPPRRKRALQLAIGLPLTVLTLGPTLFAVWIVWAPHTVEVSIGDGWLHIETGPAPIGRHRTVDLADIRGVETVQLEGGRRVAGTGLPGYCVGHYSYRNVGRVWQATDCSRDVLLLRVDNEKPLLLTPPDPDRFITAISTGGSYAGVQAPPQTGRGWIFIRILVALLPLAGLIIPLVFIVAPDRLRYRVEPGELVVASLTGSRSFTTAGAMVRLHRPKIGLRLWGTGAPGYYTGLYRVDGENTKVFTTSVESGILIEGGGLRLLVNPEDEEAFLEAMRTVGGATTE